MMTSREISERWNPSLEPWQHDANTAYIENCHRLLKPGGIWGYPAHNLTFKKLERGWELIEEIK